MTEHKCKNCGAPLRALGFDKYFCDYCGSVYEAGPHDGLKVLTITPANVVTLRHREVIAGELLWHCRDCEHDIMEAALKHAAQEIAYQMVKDKLIEVRVDEWMSTGNFIDGSKAIDCRVRICKPLQ